MGPDTKIVVFGAGVIGGSVGGWLAPHHENLWFVARGPTAKALRNHGVTLFPGETPERRATVPVRVIDDIREAGDVDVVLVAVKNYSLESAAQNIYEAVGDRPLVVGLQNGIANQTILPKYFSRVLYAVICYNAWGEAPGLIGYQKHGPIVLGSPDNDLVAEADSLAALMTSGVPAHATVDYQDAAHCKLVINLANSFTTLVGHGVRRIRNRARFQQLLTQMIWEGVEVLRAAGFHESRLGGMPSWLVLWALAHLPRLITRPIFEVNVRKMVLSSMAQDVIQRGQDETELETINGYLLELAAKHRVATPLNRTVYELCRREFARPEFRPLSVDDVWAALQRHHGGEAA